MKEHIKDSFKESFQHKASDEFTNKLMNRLAREKQAQITLLPKSLLWFVILSFVMVLGFVLISIKNSISITLPTSQVLDVVNALLPSLILPFCIATLLFIQQVFHYRKIS